MKLLKAIAFATTVSLAAVGIAGAKGGYGGGSHATSSSHISSHVSSGDHYVHSYLKKDGTFVSGYHATNPNGTRNDNYSTRGNVNPYTGEPGTKPRDEDGPR